MLLRNKPLSNTLLSNAYIFMIWAYEWFYLFRFILIEYDNVTSHDKATKNEIHEIGYIGHSAKIGSKHTLSTQAHYTCKLHTV